MPKLWPKREYNPCIDTPEYAKILEFFTKDNATEEEYTAWDTITSAWINASPAIEQYQLKIFADALNSRVRNRMVVVQRNYDTYQAQYTSYMNNLSSCIKNMEQAANELIGLRTNTAIFGKEILDYIKTNKAIKAYQVTQNGLILTVETPLEYFNQDLIQRYLEREGSLILCHKDNFSKIKEFCTDVFIKGKYQIWTKANYCVDFNNATVYKDDNKTAEYQNSDLYEHPHLMYHNCWGNGGPKIVQELKNNNYLGAIEQTIACCKNINTGDGVVLDDLMDDLCRYKNKLAIGDENGTLYSINQLYYAPAPAPEPAPEPVTETMPIIG
jgi:hypothetical protein